MVISNLDSTTVPPFIMKRSKPLPAKKTLGHIASNSRQQKEPSPNTTSNTNFDNTDQICDICAQNVPGPERERIFALGKCDHRVCYVCSTRLRAICDQHECPICREKIDHVIFCTDMNKAYDKHDTGSYIFDEKYKIYFETAAIKDAFTKLLRFGCLECLKSQRPVEQSNMTIDNEFQDVFKLRNHLNTTHKLTLCDLCLKHNKLFPFEYSYYDQGSLRKHMRDGEPNTSHRGHPECILCHSTFFNQDDLLLHMSREHFHCHLCGRHNPNMHVYFADYPSLRAHFKARHFLCMRGNCQHEQFTSAFEDRCAYDLHVAQVHGGSVNPSRGEARQQRTITLDPTPHRAPVHQRQSSHIPNAAIVYAGTPATANASDPRRQIPEAIQQQIRQQRLPARSEFPTLNHASRSNNAARSTVSSGPGQNSSYSQNNSGQPSRIVSLQHRIIAGPSSARPSFVRCAGGGNIAPERLDEMDFPPLPEQPKSKKSKPKSRQPKANSRDDGMTLDQLINSSLTLSTRSINQNRPNKSNKNAKPKALKIQL